MDPIQDNIEANDHTLIHTLLFLVRENNMKEDLEVASKCLRSLEKSAYKTVVVYNQGCFTNDQLKSFLDLFGLKCIVIGNGNNAGTVIGRQSCFEWIEEHYQNARFISELHLDMVFTNDWEKPLIHYLDTHDEPIISCGIIDKDGYMNFLEKRAEHFQGDLSITDDFLMQLRCDRVVHGFTNPCIHVAEILKCTGGYNPKFLKGKQCFEDDSMLLGYYYYYGTRASWYPKVNYNSVVYHAVAGQRLGMMDSVLINYEGLVRQYGAMGLKHLSELHKSLWHIRYFKEQYERM